MTPRERVQGNSVVIPRKSLIIGICLTALLTGCATTLRHPQTQATVTCGSGAWVGIGLIGLAVAAVGNLVEAAVYQDCIQKAKTLGYEEVQ